MIEEGLPGGEGGQGYRCCLDGIHGEGLQGKVCRAGGDICCGGAIAEEGGKAIDGVADGEVGGAGGEGSDDAAELVAGYGGDAAIAFFIGVGRVPVELV